MTSLRNSQLFFSLSAQNLSYIFFKLPQMLVKLCANCAWAIKLCPQSKADPLYCSRFCAFLKLQKHFNGRSNFGDFTSFYVEHVANLCKNIQHSKLKWNNIQSALRQAKDSTDEGQFCPTRDIHRRLLYALDNDNYSVHIYSTYST